VGSAVDTMVWSSAANSSTGNSAPKIIRIDRWGAASVIAVPDACAHQRAPRRRARIRLSKSFGGPGKPGVQSTGNI